MHVVKFRYNITVKIERVYVTYIDEGNSNVRVRPIICNKALL